MGSLDSGKRWVCADRFGGRDAARGAFRHGGGGERAACHCGPGRAARLCAVAAAAGVAVGGSSHALRRGRTVLIVEHDMDAMFELADKITVLYDEIGRAHV